jgi:LmbE family N-acetylglucosaminyl deacetylase
VLKLGLGAPAHGGYEILCIGAHSDDIEIGCGGTLFRLLRELPVARLTWVVLSGNDARAEEARQGARPFLALAREGRLVLKSFRDGFFPYTAVPIKEFFEELKREVRPDLVLTHYREDRHQDHRLVSDLTYNSFRDHLVLEYEIPKFDGDLGRPNTYVALDQETCKAKVTHLLAAFGTQRDKRWFSEDTFRAMLRLRGIEAGSPSGFAEAFHGRKIVL